MRTERNLCFTPYRLWSIVSRRESAINGGLFKLFAQGRSDWKYFCRKTDNSLPVLRTMQLIGPVVGTTSRPMPFSRTHIKNYFHCWRYAASPRDGGFYSHTRSAPSDPLSTLLSFSDKHPRRGILIHITEVQLGLTSCNRGHSQNTFTSFI
ncbi:hypothetical protein BDQ17DRAFT_569377 [Cyathus striatus]|nr:hypothetical protein BDQ17DRAFT_569377 [Cyathus striatus]